MALIRVPLRLSKVCEGGQRILKSSFVVMMVWFVVWIGVVEVCIFNDTVFFSPSPSQTLNNAYTLHSIRSVSSLKVRASICTIVIVHSMYWQYWRLNTWLFIMLARQSHCVYIVILNDILRSSLYNSAKCLNPPSIFNPPHPLSAQSLYLCLFLLAWRYSSHTDW